ncbi:MAG: hypothetical protein QOH72_4636 [Solirubrobacteraceae bacterium]|nr:hypothetical protein [Solirubrobacteraceae bacterium]
MTGHNAGGAANLRGSSSGAMPGPVSETSSSTRAPARRALSRIVPGAGVSFTALETMLPGGNLNR